MGNAESGTEAQETSSLSSGRPRSPPPDLATIDEENHHQVIDVTDRYGNNRENNGDFRNFEINVDAKFSNTPSIGFEVSHEEEEEEEPPQLFSGVENVMSEEGAMSLMEASAAVFHYLAREEWELDQDADDELSESQRSAAVFKYLETESRRGNPDPVVRFLETATVVSAVLLEDVNSVSDASADIFNYLENGADDTSVSERSAAVFRLLDDARSVDPSLADRSAAVFKYLDDARSVDARSISEFSSAIFQMLDDAKNHDARSVTQRSATVFQLLDDTTSIKHTMSPKSQRTLPHANRNRVAPPSHSSLGDTVTYNTEDISYAPASKYSKTANSHREDYPEVGMVFSEHQEQVKSEEINADDEDEDYPEVDFVFAGRQDQGHPEQLKSEEVNADDDDDEDDDEDEDDDDDNVDDNMDGNVDGNVVDNVDGNVVDNVDDNVVENADEDIDLSFVQDFDSAFNEFIGQHPKYLMKNPDLVHHIRITKLQKLLEFMDVHESDLVAEMAHLKADKGQMEETYQLYLREASRKKAARQINLQSDLNKLGWSTKLLETSLTWKFVDSSEARSKKQFQLRKKFKRVTPGQSREELLKLVPEGPDGQGLRDAIYAPPCNDSDSDVLLSGEQEQDLRTLQVDNAFLNAEVTVLKKKLAYKQIAAKKFSWVESILLRMDSQTMSKLKTKYMKKAGVQTI